MTRGDGDLVWYFAYGSNLDHDRFRERVGPWIAHERARLDDYELRFSGEVTSEGGGGAIIVPAPGRSVNGGVYRITLDQLARLDDMELGNQLDPSSRGERKELTLHCPAFPLQVTVYMVPRPRVYRAPSAKYLAHIVKGLRDFGHDESVIREVEERARREPGAGDV